MKKHLLSLITTLFLAVCAASAQVVVNADITANTTWTKNNIYLLQGGCLYVKNDATLTIEPGTLIKGDAAALIITRGSKIIADGTPESPIVFTSSKPAGQRNPGDWGGLLIMGKAPINVPGGETVVEGGCSEALYGGTDPSDNSGILRYVRIEFAGIPFQPNNELNSLTLGGVGNGTVIEHVQTSYGGDDAYEWFGGTVNGRWLVNLATVDDMFDVDFGYQGKNQWLLGISNPNIADVSGSNGFETDNDAQGSTNEPKTDGHFSNVTIVGPLGQGIDPVNSNFKRALHVRRCSYLDIFNSTFTGFPVGYKLDGTCTTMGFTSGTEVFFKNNIIAGSPIPIEPVGDAAVTSQFNSSGSSILPGVTDVMLTDPFNATSPNFLPMAGSPLLSGADFSAPELQDPFFTPTTYRGAFGEEDWTSCWCEWDPINANYDVAPIQYISKPAINASGPLTFCQGGTVVLTAPAGFSYAWSNGATTQAITVSAAGTYTVTVTNARGCTASSDAVAVVVNANPNAGFNFTVNGATVVFTNTSSGGVTYNWNLGDGVTSTAPSLSHTYSTAGTYTVCLTATTAAGCSDTECQSVAGVQNPTVVIVNNDITSNTTWTNNNIYVLQGGCVYVRDNSVLTIQPGTVIRGEAAALIIQRGSKIIADGTPTRPIVFTSNKPAGERTPGDWGGILIMGRAPINVPGGETVVEGGCDLAVYGGNDPADNSGILRYVRIEFAGIPFQPNNELNSLTLGGVGSGTVIEHVQTSYGGDDAYEWFGGTVNGKWLVNYATVDDMFDVDFGYQGKNQWLLGISDPNIADVSGSNGFESDNDAQGSTNGPKTDGHFSNVTILGPLGQGVSPINSNFKRALHIRRCSYLDVFNSAFAGFPVGLKLDGTCVIDGFTTNGEVEFAANLLAQNTTPIEPVGDMAVQMEFDNSGNGIVPALTDLQLTAPFDFAGNNPDFRPAAGSPLLSAADFSSPTVADAFFTPTTYRGAVGDTDWTDCWTEWNPITADYTNSINYGLTPGISYTATDQQVAFTGTTAGAVSYFWDFGDGTTSTLENPSHTFGGVTSATVTLTVTSSRGCVSTATADVVLTGVEDEIEGLAAVQVFPNPFRSVANVSFTLSDGMDMTVQLVDVNGRLVRQFEQYFQSGANHFEVDAADLKSGVYFLRLLAAQGQHAVRLSVVK
jgi:PKD repeat protein